MMLRVRGIKECVGGLVVCRRNPKALLKQLGWIVIWTQLVAISLLALSFRESGRSRAFFASNVVGPLLSNLEMNNVSEWKFRHLDPSYWNASNKVSLSDVSSSIYFRRLDTGIECFIEGTDFSLSRSECICHEEYFGPECGIPASAWFGHFKKHRASLKALRRRDQLRRVLHAVPVNHEFDFFETRVRSLSDVVDVFVIQESDFTTFGERRELLFLDKLKRGWLREWQHKMSYVRLSNFLDKGKVNGWYADAYLRFHLTRRALESFEGASGEQMLRDDDLFLLLDADELPSREALLFLKLYDGYTEPIRFGFRWNVFGFFWLKAVEPVNDPLLNALPSFLGKLLGGDKGVKEEQLLQLYVVCTMGMLRTVYNANGMLLRRNVYRNQELKERLNNYTLNHRVEEWDMGVIGHYAGFHCSWCYSPEGIRVKLMSAQRHDKPRWGDYPEKTNVTYIKQIIKKGEWFDGKQPFIKVDPLDVGDLYAPQYIMRNSQRFKYLLVNENNNEISDEQP